MRLWFAALFALATIALGFGHRPLSLGPDSAAAAEIEAVQAALTLPDGTVVAICSSDSDHPGTAAGHGGHAAHDAPCDACRVSSAPGLLPTPPNLPLPAGKTVESGLTVADLIPASPVFAPASRGPPAHTTH